MYKIENTNGWFNTILIKTDDYSKENIYLKEINNKNEIIITKEIEEAIGFINDENTPRIQDFLLLIKLKLKKTPKVIKIEYQTKYKIIGGE